jgi:hypothetical protein
VSLFPDLCKRESFISGLIVRPRELARRLGFEYLDTGAMYRAVTWLCLEGRLDLTDHACVAETARRAEFDFREGRVFANGQDVSDAIRTIRVTEESRFVAANTAGQLHCARSLCYLSLNLVSCRWKTNGEYYRLSIEWHHLHLT